jgi:hypothetical protein
MKCSLHRHVRNRATFPTQEQPNAAPQRSPPAREICQGWYEASNRISLPHHTVGALGQVWPNEQRPNGRASAESGRSRARRQSSAPALGTAGGCRPRIWCFTRILQCPLLPLGRLDAGIPSSEPTPRGRSLAIMGDRWSLSRMTFTGGAAVPLARRLHLVRTRCWPCCTLFPQRGCRQSRMRGNEEPPPFNSREITDFFCCIRRRTSDCRAPGAHERWTWA